VSENGLWWLFIFILAIPFAILLMLFYMACCVVIACQAIYDWVSGEEIA
jgi:hypothetical protein